MRPGDDRGSVIVIAAASLVALLGLAALVVDLGDSRQRSRENQSVSDMASLAAATDLSSNAANAAASGTAHATAVAYAESNLGLALNSTACRTAGAGRHCYAGAEAYVEITTPYPGVTTVPAHQQVHVKVCSQSPGFFAPVVGATPSEVCRAATAMLDETIVITPAILALDPSGPEAFHLEGAAQAVGVGGSLVANSSSSSSFHMKDATSATATGPSACICAAGISSINGSATASPIAASHSDLVNDPWATLVEPSGLASGSYDSATKTFTPGTFGAVQLDQAGTYTFLPGIYEFTGQFKIEGSGVNVVAESVLWFFGSGGSVNWGSGTNYIRISSRPPGEYYGGNNGAFPPVAIFQSRANTEAFNIGDDIRVGVVNGGTCNVTPSAGISGGVYLPTAELRVRGNTSSGLCAEGAPVVAHRVQIQETGFVQGATGGSSGTPVRATFLAE